MLVRPLDGYSLKNSWDGRIFSSDGQCIRKFRIGSWQGLNVDLTSLPSGVYVIELYAGNKYLGAEKFVKTTHR
jgi:hypothetical protein